MAVSSAWIDNDSGFKGSKGIFLEIFDGSLLN